MYENVVMIILTAHSRIGQAYLGFWGLGMFLDDWRSSDKTTVRNQIALCGVHVRKETKTFSMGAVTAKRITILSLNAIKFLSCIHKNLVCVCVCVCVCVFVPSKFPPSPFPLQGSRLPPTQPPVQRTSRESFS